MEILSIKCQREHQKVMADEVCIQHSPQSCNFRCDAVVVRNVCAIDLIKTRDWINFQ